MSPRILKIVFYGIGTAYQNTPPPADGDALIDGSLGIGTTTLAHALNIGSAPFWTSDGWRGAIALPNISAIGWAANVAGQRMGMGHTTGGFGIFRTLADPGTTAQPSVYDFFINDAGRVGIGTTNPVDAAGGWGGGNQRTKVWLQDGAATATFPSLVIAGGTAATGGGAVQFLDSSRNPVGDFGTAPGEVGMVSRSSARSLTFYTTPPAGATARRMTILPNGNVGIGAPAPSQPLEVIGNILARRAAGTNDQILLGAADSNVGLRLQSGTTGGTPYLDFSRNAANPSDGRLILVDNDNFRMEGARLHLASEEPPLPVLPAMPIAAPNGRVLGNLSANDIWLRSANPPNGAWASATLGGAAAGSYVGNGASNRLINVGFQPKKVDLIDSTAGQLVVYMKMQGMPVDRSYDSSHDRLWLTYLNLVPNGFTVGRDFGSGDRTTNIPGRTYYYTAYP
ncbi:MAG: hypothetical protein HYZ94_00605 [Candidatus Omnitrophica bacterium]|nr:hypothetical protein [Candidatus Omnitrophota bacterium]